MDKEPVSDDLNHLIQVIAEHRARWCAGKAFTQEDVDARLKMPSVEYEARAILKSLPVLSLYKAAEAMLIAFAELGEGQWTEERIKAYTDLHESLSLPILKPEGVFDIVSSSNERINNV